PGRVRRSVSRPQAAPRRWRTDVTGSAMNDHRRSYLKTIIAAGVAFGGSTVVAGVIASRPTDLVALRALQAVLVLLPIPGAGWVLLVVAGGVIALRRDTLESKGLPYAPRAPRERQAGWIVRAMWATSRALRAPFRGNSRRLDLRPGEIVEVRSFAEIQQ